MHTRTSTHLPPLQAGVDFLEGRAVADWHNEVSLGLEGVGTRGAETVVIHGRTTAANAACIVDLLIHIANDGPVINSADFKMEDPQLQQDELIMCRIGLTVASFVIEPRVICVSVYSLLFV